MGGPPPGEAAPTAAVEAALDAFHAAAAQADGPGLLRHFAWDGVFLGTDATERWAGPAFRAFVAERFADGVGWTMRAARRGVTLEGDVAWFDEDLVHARLGGLRGSGVLRRGADGHWRITQYNLSLTVPNERFQAVRDLLSRDCPSLGPTPPGLPPHGEGAGPSPR